MPVRLSLSRLVPRRPQQAQQPPRRRGTAHHSQPQPSRFLQLPTDLVLYLCDQHLEPSTAVSLSLACKSLFALLFPSAKPRLTRPERLQLQLLLERDPAANCWYCDTCCFLHPISSRGPTRGARPAESCADQAAFLLSGSGFALSYQAVRLAMNQRYIRHPRGLTLERFNLSLTAAGQLRWKEEWSARIIQNELFLSCRRTLSAPPWPDEEVRYALNVADPAYQLCRHFTTSAWDLSAPNALTRGSVRPHEVFVPCRDYVESCRQCLSDFVTTVEQRVRTKWSGKEEKYWYFAITSYHRLGSGMSPSDEKWKALVGTRGTAFNPWREMDVYPRASVREMWQGADAAYLAGGRQESDTG